MRNPHRWNVLLATSAWDARVSRTAVMNPDVLERVCFGRDTPHFPRGGAISLRSVDAGNMTPSEMANPFPTRGRLAAIDFGTVRVGVAICDPDWILASPLAVIETRGEQPSAEEFRRLADEERVAGWVVGLPIHADGNEGIRSQQARQFARWLSEETRRPVRMFDERYSTRDASQRLQASGIKRRRAKPKLDATAAMIILESFLEACRHRGSLAGVEIDQIDASESGPLED